MVRDRIPAPLGQANATDGSTLTARPTKPPRAASYSIDLSSDLAHTSTPAQQPEVQPQQVFARNPTTPTTPTFILSPSGLFGGDGKDNAGERLLLGGWIRSKNLSKSAKQRPSLHRPSTLLSDNEKTDVASLASDADDKDRLAAGRGSHGFWGIPPLRHMLYTKKGRRGVALNMRAWTSYRSVLTLLLLLLLSVKLLFTPSTAVERGVNGELTKHKATDAVFLNTWIDHVIHHPVRARDKVGFAEMGLRTEMYSHLLRHPTLPNFDRMERALWPFVPGINQLRKWWQASVQAKPSPYTLTEEASNVRLISRAFGRGPIRQPGSRGIVMSLGYKGSVFASQFISIIREKHRNDIPIELYYYGDSDLPAKYRDYLTKTYRNVRCIDLESLGLFDPDLVQLERQGFAIKPFALLATNFTEVMLADADAILLENPDRFFEEPGYLDTGTLFFHDRDHLRPGADDIIQDFMNNQLSLRGPSPRLAQSEFWKKKGIFEQESGIVVMDKRKTDVFAALLFTAWQNMGEIRKKTTYRIWWGDKETFWLAFEFSNFPYYFVPRYAQAIGTTRRRSKAERIAAAKAKAEKADKEKAGKKDKVGDAGGEGGEGGATENEEEKRKMAKKQQDKVPILFDDQGDAIDPVPAAAELDENPFKEGIQPGQPEAKAHVVAQPDDNVALPPTDSKDSASTISSDLIEEEEFCSEHPLHFLGADAEDANHDGLLDTLTLGRPAWFNGGILDVKVLSDEIYIQPNAFSLDGAWVFNFEEEKWCIRNYTLGNMKQFDLTDRIDEIKTIAKKAEDKFRSKIPKVKSVKQAVLQNRK